MEQVITQVAGLTKEVAIAYMVLYGVIELSKIGLGGFLIYQSCKCIKALIQAV